MEPVYREQQDVLGVSGVCIGSGAVSLGGGGRDRGGLRNYLGERVDLASYRGKAGFVTFLYTHAPARGARPASSAPARCGVRR